MDILKKSTLWRVEIKQVNNKKQTKVSCKNEIKYVNQT